MLSLDSVLRYDDINAVAFYTKQRFKDRDLLKTPEALTLHEQSYLTDEQIKELCEKAYGFELHEPVRTYMPEMIIQHFEGTGYVPVVYQPMRKTLTVVYVEDIYHKEEVTYSGHEVITLPTTLYYYLEAYQQYYGTHAMLNEIPAATHWMDIIREASDLGAADVTISSLDMSTQVYYNVRKRRVDSKKVYSYEFITDLIKLLTDKSPMDWGSRMPKSLDVELNKDYRGRIQINAKGGVGYIVTMRMLPKGAFNTDISELSLAPKTVDWLKESFLDNTPGLRLMVGETLSGKNTTILSLIRILAMSKRYKIVSIEQPVEQILPGLEQISVEKEDEFDANAKSLVRMNPDIVYITEIRDSIGLSVLQMCNTGKIVYSTLHSNGVADTISRLMDITGQSLDRVIQSLHSVCYQKLLRDEELDKLYPIDRYVRFTDDLKYKLYGKSLGEVIQIINDIEEGD